LRAYHSAEKQCKIVDLKRKLIEAEKKAKFFEEQSEYYYNKWQEVVFKK